mmetsp:Transcript_23920/g.47752  ORF Transcript_23920/g.47752 Transcript_23920/m.47752 type:complete len:84 (+) Transcript_23920:1643-1894(+)
MNKECVRRLLLSLFTRCRWASGGVTVEYGDDAGLDVTDALSGLVNALAMNAIDDRSSSSLMMLLGLNDVKAVRRVWMASGVMV